MGEARRPADLWQRHLGEGPPRRGRMTWDECQSKLLALTAEVARSAPATSPEKVEDFLRTEREIGLVEELAAFICEHFREVDEVRWLPLASAAEMLTYERDRALLEAFARGSK